MNKEELKLEKRIAELEGQVTRAFEVLKGKRKRIEELEKEAEEKGCKYLDKVEKIYGDGDVSDTGYTGYQIIKAYEQGALDFAEPREKRIVELEQENAELSMKRKAERKIFQGIVEKKTDQLIKAKYILQIVLDEWKENRWILQSDKEVQKIENLMEQAEQFLKGD